MVFFFHPEVYPQVEGRQESERKLKTKKRVMESFSVGRGIPTFTVEEEIRIMNKQEKNMSWRRYSCFIEQVRWSDERVNLRVEGEHQDWIMKMHWRHSWGWTWSLRGSVQQHSGSQGRGLEKVDWIRKSETIHWEKEGSKRQRSSSQNKHMKEKKERRHKSLHFFLLNPKYFSAEQLENIPLCKSAKNCIMKYHSPT